MREYPLILKRPRSWPDFKRITAIRRMHEIAVAAANAQK